MLRLRFTRVSHSFRSPGRQAFSTTLHLTEPKKWVKMGKKNRAIPEEAFKLPAHPFFAPPGVAGEVATASPASRPGIVDTHTHLLSTFAAYRQKYLDGKYITVHEFVRGLYLDGVPEGQPKVTDIVDVWCEAPVTAQWRELADSALTEEQRKNDWGGINYWFVIGVHPHEAKLYNDDVELDLIAAASHPRCVGMGEMGLDYHYDNSPRDIQKAVLIRQLKNAVALQKPLTIHTREADEDILAILKEHVPRDHRIHIHCFTDTPELAQSLLDWFPNLYIGITGVITYATNLNTSEVIRSFARLQDNPRFVLETDAPYMVPSNMSSQSLGLKNGQKLPFSHSSMIPWTAEFVSNVANPVVGEEGTKWTPEYVLKVGMENARRVYTL